jgi:lipopolysaccharide biosynthesis regulator YciM
VSTSAAVQTRNTHLIKQFQIDLKLIQEDGDLPIEKLTEVKGELMHLLPEVKSLAQKGVAKAQYYFALAFPKESDEYLFWMKNASSRGVVDAHYALGKRFLENGDMNKAGAVFSRVLKSSDAFLKDEVLTLMHSDPQLAKELTKPNTSRLGFFDRGATSKLAQQEESQFNKTHVCGA